MRKIARKLNSLTALVMALVLLGTATALAAQACSLRVVLRCGGAGVPGVQVELVQVAGGVGETLALKEAFSALGISAGELDPGAETAERVFQYVCARNVTGQVRTTGADGEAAFTALEEGVYLVMERGGQAVAFQPYLVSLGTGGQRDVTSAPKTSETDTKTLLAVKLWDDGDDAARCRPDSIQLRLLRDGTPIRRVTLSAENGWQHRFTMLPSGGSYTVEEEAVADYAAEYVPAAEGFVIRNRYTGGDHPSGGGEEKAHVRVKKVWQDDNDAAGKRPDAVTVQLIAEDTVIRTAVLSEGNHWSHTFSGLDPGKSYTVQEIAVEDYTASYAGNAAMGITLTNTYSGKTDPGSPPAPIIPEPDRVDIPVEVRWVDGDNAAGVRPEMVTVYLCADASVVASVQLHDGNGWKGVFKGVPADLSYSVWQSSAPLYVTAYAGSAAEGFVVTNTYTGDVTDPGVPPQPTEPEQPPAPQEPMPEGPVIPQTGAEILPVYFLMAAGAVLVLLGAYDLYRGRKEE